LLRNIITRITFLCVFIVASSIAKATIVHGKINDSYGQPVAFATITVEGSNVTAMSNDLGSYVLRVSPGLHKFTCKHVGFGSLTLEKGINGDSVEINFDLKPVTLTLNEVIIKKNNADPAYAIIQSAIAQRQYHQEQLAEYTCLSYIKGMVKTIDFPSSILGQRIDFEDGDASKQKIIFLSESISQIHFQQPDRTNIKVLATKVSGQTNGLGLATPFLLSFYDNLVNLPKSFNPRGFVSPIAEGAMGFYDYKYLGAFSENGFLINRIQVFPKREWEPLFKGFIEIVEDTWNIHAVDLTLNKTSQLEFADKIQIVQLYKHESGDIWLLRSQQIFPEVNLLGFKAAGHFSSVFENYDLTATAISKKLSNVIIKYDAASTQMSDSFWKANRPIPLLAMESADFLKKDSLEKKRQDPAYLDSLDHLQNRLTLLGFALNGQTLLRRSKGLRYTYDPLLKSIGFNTIEGMYFQYSATLEKQLQARKSISFMPVLRYGESNGHLTGFITTKFNYGGKVLNKLSLSLGKRIFQFNNANPIPQVMNTFATLLGGSNYIKLYQADFFQFSLENTFGNGLELEWMVSYQNRKPLQNTVGAGQWGKFKKISDLSPNYPVELVSSSMSAHKALDAGFRITYQPGAQYVELPDGNKNKVTNPPSIVFQYNKGLPGIWGTTSDYDKWKLSVSGQINLRLAGEFRYKAQVAGFLQSKNLQLPDYNHYAGNLTRKAAPYLESFQVAPFYAFSNERSVFGIFHAEYKLNGLLTNKIPLIRQLNFRLVTGSNLMVIKGIDYQEVFVGVDNVAKLFRIDYVKGLGKDGKNYGGIKIGVRGFSSLFADN
jgi:Family of unknown function (DUF5686)/CarboxypepD_reg-like domain